MIDNGWKNYAADEIETSQDSFTEVKSLLKKCQLVLANLEGPVTELGVEYDPREDPGPAYSFNMDPSATSVFKEVGITHFGRANNHLRDRGEDGVLDTSRHLKEAGLPNFGFGTTKEQAATPLMLETQYGIVGITGFSEIYQNTLEPDSAKNVSGILPVTEEHASLGMRLLQEKGADVRIAFVHWGGNYGDSIVVDEQRDLAAILAQYDYDLIVGSGGSHTVQEFDIVDGVPVLYNVGNFVFSTPGRFQKEEVLPYGSVVNVLFDDAGQLRTLEMFCTFVDNRVVGYQPKICTADQANELFSSLGDHVEHAEGETFAKIDLQKVRRMVEDGKRAVLTNDGRYLRKHTA